MINIDEYIAKRDSEIKSKSTAQATSSVMVMLTLMMALTGPLYFIFYT